MSSAAMLRLASLISLVVLSLGEQAPIAAVSSHRKSSPPSQDTEWNLPTAERPSANTTYNLVFDSVASLLQRWPNTRYRNGHNVVAGTIPAGTLLYHGSHFSTPPEGREWTALDPEHSYLFSAYCAEGGDKDFYHRVYAEDRRNSTSSDLCSCWHLTLTNPRPLKVLYFDGSSAAKLPLLLRNRRPGFNKTKATTAPSMAHEAGGPLDTQDVLLWGEPRDDMILHDDERLEEMCRKWGRGGEEVGESGGGFDGFVRMQMSFEVMLCNFTSSTTLLSSLSLHQIDFPSDPDDPPPGPVMTSLIEAGSWHNSFPGETRISLDLTRLVSFFDVGLAPSLVEERDGKERWQYRVGRTSERDVERVRERLREIMKEDGDEPKSGIDWRTLLHTIMDRYAERLEAIRDLLEPTSTFGEASLDERKRKEVGRKVQTVLRLILTPYITKSVVPPARPAHEELSNNTITLESDLSWASPTFKYCSTIFTQHLFSEEVERTLTKSEVLIRDAIHQTNREICRVATGMWALGVEYGLDSALPNSKESQSGGVDGVIQEWRKDVDSLMKWLDWSVWVKCKPECSSEEFCYLPTWPLLDPIPAHREGGEKNIQNGESEVDWLDPTPRCVRKVSPYEL